MNKLNCDDLLILKMAEADGEHVEFSDEATLHFEQCEICRNEFAQMQVTNNLMMKQIRSEQNVDLWPRIEKRISSSNVGRFPFAVLAILLVGYKLFEMLPDQDPGLAFKVVPLAIVLVMFILIKENPFRVSSELTLER